MITSQGSYASEGEPGYIDPNSCASYVGFQGAKDGLDGGQVLNLALRNCKMRATVQHELLHALGRLLNHPS